MLMEVDLDGKFYILNHRAFSNPASNAEPSTHVDMKPPLPIYIFTGIWICKVV